MTALLLVVMNYRYWGNTFHEVVGVLWVVLYFWHNLWNRKWYSALDKGRWTSHRRMNDGVNLLLLAAMLTALVSGVMISQTVFASLDIRSSLTAHDIHSLAGYAVFLLIAVHLGLHWEALMRRTRLWMGIEEARLGYSLACHIAAIFVMGYGVYASFIREIGGKLLMEHSFTFWETAPTFIVFTLDFLAIMGLYIGGTYYLLRCFARRPQSYLDHNEQE